MGGVDPLLSIGVFARRSWLSLKALRLYERLGLLVPVQVGPDNGYRRYHERQLATARLIVMLRRLDMPLAQVAAVVAAASPQGAEVSMLRAGQAGSRAAELAASPAAASLVADYWESVERRIASQRALATHLRMRLLGEQGAVLDMYTVQQRDIPEQLVLTEQRHVQVADLAPWLEQAIDRLMGTAGRYGGPSGPVFVIYHGEVNQESDGPVEVCVPIAASNGMTIDAPSRREAAHREAFVRITKAQVQYPQILSAFDAVAQWLTAQGLSTAVAPREVYFTDFAAAKPTDEVCDVAFPMS